MRKGISIVIVLVMMMALILPSVSASVSIEDVKAALEDSLLSSSNVKDSVLNLKTEDGSTINDITNPELIHKMYHIKNDGDREHDIFYNYQSGSFDSEFDTGNYYWMIPQIEGDLAVKEYYYYPGAAKTAGASDIKGNVSGLRVIYSYDELISIINDANIGMPQSIKRAIIAYPSPTGFLYVKTDKGEYIIPMFSSLGNYYNKYHEDKIGLQTLIVYTADEFVAFYEKETQGRKEYAREYEEKNVNTPPASVVDENGEVVEQSSSPSPSPTPKPSEEPKNTPAPTIEPTPSPSPSPVVTPTPTPEPIGESMFDDVPTDHWAYEEIKFFYNAGIVAGMGDRVFAPDSNVSREEFAKLLAIIFSRTQNIATEQTFSNVTPDMWSYNYIEAVKMYLTGYYPDKTQPFFNPKGKASREDIAYSLAKISGINSYGLKNPNILTETFSDASDVSPTLKEFVGIAIEKGLIKGYADGTFRPTASITRAETVVLLLRTLKAPVSNKVSDDLEAPISKDKSTINASVFSGSPMYFRAPGMKEMITPDSGTASYSWRTDKLEGALKAEYKIGNDIYTFISVEVIRTNEEGFEGYFEVAKNGEVIEKRLKGKVYGNENTFGVYPYFKFYSEGEKWHFSGQMTEMVKENS